MSRANLALVLRYDPSSSSTDLPRFSASSFYSGWTEFKCLPIPCELWDCFSYCHQELFFEWTCSFTPHMHRLILHWRLKGTPLHTSGPLFVLLLLVWLFGLIISGTFTSVNSHLCLLSSHQRDGWSQSF